MKDDMTSNEQFVNIGQELLAYCLSKQGREDEAFSCVKGQMSDGCMPEQMLLLGHLCSQQRRWDQAVAYLAELNKQDNLDDGLKRRGSDCLLNAAIHFSEQKAWDRALECLSKAQSLCPDNLSLDHIPANIEADLPIVFFRAGDYGKAIEIWESELKKGNFQPKTVHLLAIAYQCMIEAGSDLPILDEAELLEKTHMHWTALSTDKEYWSKIFEQRSSTYGPEVSEDDFFSIALKLGAGRCETRLDQLDAKIHSEDDTGLSQALAEAQIAVAVERHSAKLLSEIRQTRELDWPKGGLKMLVSFCNSDRLENALATIESREIGSPGWLIKGLRNGDSRAAFVHFLNGDYVACLNGTEQTEDKNLWNLMGLALIRRAEIALEAGHAHGCQKMASGISRIPDPSLRHKAEELLEKIAVKRLKEYMSRGQQDEAIEFLIGILAEVELVQIKDSLSSVLLKRSEARYDKGDIEGFIEDYDKALYYARDKSICEKELKKIVRYHLNKSFEKKDFRDSLSFLERLKSKYPRMGFLKAQHYFFTALEKLEKRGSGDSSVLDLLEKAYNADRNEKQISSIYSSALASKAVEVVNDATDGYASSYTIRNAISESESLLLKALKIDPSNEAARNNLLQLMELSINAGISL